jgi:hypothetical protein
VAESDSRGVCIVVIGAGASFDCSGMDYGGIDLEVEGLRSLPYAQVRPPLTNQLVEPSLFHNEIISRYPQCRPLIGELQTVLDRNGSAISLERALADYAESAEEDPERKVHLMAMRFYIRDLLWAASDFMLSNQISGGVTNYVKLLTTLRMWAIKTNRLLCFVSFNYDTLLESACASYWQFDPHDLDSYLADDWVKVVKPHGSIAWVWPATVEGEALSSNQSWERATIVATNRLDDPVRILPRRMTRGALVSLPPAVPALALPMDGKAEFVWPPEQDLFFGSLEDRATHLITIGWRGAEPHFLARLGTALSKGAKSVIVGRSASDVQTTLGIVEHAVGRARQISQRGFDRGFSEFLRSGEVEDFLRW